MAKITKYIPVWHVKAGGVSYSPPKAGEAPIAIKGLSEDTIKMLLAKGAIKALTYDDGSEEAESEVKAESEGGAEGEEEVKAEAEGEGANNKAEGDAKDEETNVADDEVDFEAMTVAQLKEYAAEQGISLNGASKKADIILVLQAAEE